MVGWSREDDGFYGFRGLSGTWRLQCPMRVVDRSTHRSLTCCHTAGAAMGGGPFFIVLFSGRSVGMICHSLCFKIKKVEIQHMYILSLSPKFTFTYFS